MQTITINHADYSNRPSFASVVAREFSDVAILPNVEVMEACLRAGGKKSKPVEIAVIGNKLATTAYRVGGEFGELFVINADDNSTTVYDLGASDEESEEACAAILAELAAI